MLSFNVGCLSLALFSTLTVGSLEKRSLQGQEEWYYLSAKTPRKEEVKRVQPPTEDCRCRPGEVSCVTDCSCVSTRRVCDGISDCPGGHDEWQCPRQICQGRFSCKNGLCVRNELTCDSVDDCGDGSDEVLCRARLGTSSFNCSQAHQFNCSDGAYCIPLAWKCDGDFDCYDKSDERDCSINATCQPSEFKCRSGRCISFSYICNGEANCEDGSDEINCASPYPTSHCKTDEFPCRTHGRCISLHYRCDGENDCGDWSDEASCGNETSCSPDNFRCHSGRCIELGWQCDGSPDCDDGEDEENCPNYLTPKDCPKGTVWCPEICISPEWQCDGEYDCPGGEDETDCDLGFTCEKDMFTCSSGECLQWNRVCDGHHDCLDGKDESDCAVKECRRLKCSYGCHKTDEGAERCICSTGFTLDKNNETCLDVDECSKFQPCSQLCENTVGSYKCSCVSGYSLRPDRQTCKAQSPPARLIFATRDDVREINLSGQEYPPIALNLQNAIAVDFHYRRGLIYWTDVTTDAILMSYRNGSGKTEIVRWGLQQPCGLAVDWYNDHIYWVDSGTRRVEVADLDGANRRPLIWTDLHKPRSIVVHPARTLIIWTDWGKSAKIESAFMDGTGRRLLIGERLYWPNGITLDYPTETLYWVDAKQHVIEAASIDGSHRRKVNKHKIPHPFAITVFEDRLFWADWKTRSIRSINKRTGKDSTVVHSEVAFPMGIKSMHPQRQPLFNLVERRGCAWNNGGCSHLCLPGAYGYNCFCPHGLYLLDDGRSCSEKPDFLLLFAQGNNIRMISLQKELKKNATAGPKLLDQPIFKTKITDSDFLDENQQSLQMDNVVPVDSVKTAMALDFTDEDDMVYWTDVDSRTISRAHLNGSGQQELVSSNIERPGGIAIDWVNKKMYWSDDGTERIEVSNLDGSNRAILMWKDLHHPRDIVVAPKDGVMFWSEWGSNASINRANMDGTKNKAIVSANLTYPNGLAIDYDTSRLFWSDSGYKTIECTDFDGNGRRKVITEILAHPFGLSIYGNHIFWSDWKTMSIYMADKDTGIGQQRLARDLKGLMDIKIFHRRKKETYFENPCDQRNGACSHLCLLSTWGYSCTCPTGILLQEDKRKCRPSPSESLVVAHRSAVRTLALDTPYLVDVVLNLPTLHNVVALDVDLIAGDIFLPDSAASIIFRCSADGLRCDGIVTGTIATVEGIAVEPSSRKIYWTDFDRQSIEVSELSGTNRRVLFTKLDKPRAITTHFPSGRLFWTDWADHHPRIEVADLDGQRREVFVSQKIAWPNGLTVDWSTSELYWTDAKLNYVEAIRLDGSNRRTVVTGTDVKHPYGVAVLGEWVYWTDWESKAIHRANKNSGRKIITLRKGLAGLMDIKALPGPPPKENPCGKDNGGCSHLCLRNPRGFSCACPTGLVLMDERRCAMLPSKYLLVASKRLVRRISLDALPFWDVGLDIPGLGNPVSIDVHYQRQLLFYTDSDFNAIRVISLENKTYPETIPTHGFTTPDGLAVDWIANNLYWTDVANKMVEVARIESYSQKVIISTNLREPRGIAVFPSEGYLFWTDWGNESKIERSSLDGSDRMTLVSSDIGWPNGLVVDTLKNRIYWTDARKDTLETSDLSGKNRVVLFDKLLHPFGVTLLDDHVYWTDWEMKGVQRADKRSGLSRQLIVKDIAEPMEIVSVDAAIQTGWNPCADRNGGCSHLCLYRSKGDIVCACPDAPTVSCSTSQLFKLDIKRNPKAASASSNQKEGRVGLITIVVAVGVVIVIVALLLAVGLLWCRGRNSRKGATESTNPPGGGLTYTNPTYSASHSDVNSDRKPFTWRRIHHDNPQGRLFEEKGEVAALISEGSSVEHESPPQTPPNRQRPPLSE